MDLQNMFKIYTKDSNGVKMNQVQIVATLEDFTPENEEISETIKTPIGGNPSDVFIYVAPIKKELSITGWIDRSMLSLLMMHNRKKAFFEDIDGEKEVFVKRIYRNSGKFFDIENVGIEMVVIG